jgi:hypothetical protein
MTAFRCKHKKSGSTCVSDCPQFTYDRLGGSALLSLFRLIHAGECIACQQQCQTGCTGPAATDCEGRLCKAFKDASTGECVASCPLGTYVKDLLCEVCSAMSRLLFPLLLQPCAASCPGLGCFGPSISDCIMPTIKTTVATTTKTTATPRTTQPVSTTAPSTAATSLNQAHGPLDGSLCL